MIRAAALRLLRARRGETALEFALIGSVFILLLLAPVEFGLMIWTGSSLQEVAAETARCVAIGSTQCTDAPAYAVSLASHWINSSAIKQSDVSVTSVSSCNNASGTFKQVTIKTSIWSGALISELGGATQMARACYPTS